MAKPWVTDETPANWARRRQKNIDGMARLRRERREREECAEGCGRISGRYYRCLPCRAKAYTRLKAKRDAA